MLILLITIFLLISKNAPLGRHNWLLIFLEFGTNFTKNTKKQHKI